MENIKILWITNILLPDICKEKDLPMPIVGGWMFSLSDYISRQPGVSLGVASIYDGSTFEEVTINNITYYLLPDNKNNEYDIFLRALWKKIDGSYKPDVVHIHGTEFPYGLSYIRACGSEKCLISIQGLTSVYARYFLGGMTASEINKHTSFYDIIRKNTLYDQQKQMTKRGEIEIEYIKTVRNILGRTDWDKTHIWAINQNAKYHFCNETLRMGFYTRKWDYRECEKYSIFLSQGIIPLKGIHQVIRSLPFILKDYPEAKVYIAGKNITTINSFKDKITIGTYGRYIRNLIKELKIEKHVVFLGNLEEEQMIQRYLKSNVFVCCSAIENSPNSLGEAQMLGVPVVSAYAGGTPDMVVDGESGFLYRFEEIEKLAKIINELFASKSCSEISVKGRQAAMERHDINTNGQRIMNIYRLIKSNV